MTDKNSKIKKKQLQEPNLGRTKTTKEEIMSIGTKLIYAIIFLIILEVLFLGTMILLSKPSQNKFNQTDNYSENFTLNYSDGNGLFDDKNAIYLGNVNAPIKIVVFSDFQCPFCNSYYSDVEKLIIRNYVSLNKVVIYYKDFPLDFHDKALQSAKAARCANEQGEFWQMHNLLYDRSSEWIIVVPRAADNIFKKYAGLLNLDINKFSNCYDNNQTLQKIENDLIYGQSIGIKGTPTIEIYFDKNKQIVVKKAIDNQIYYNSPQAYNAIETRIEGNYYIVRISGLQSYFLFKEIIESAG
ncbi:MAG: DsbA family protein [Candidatus Micrarchaeota archaeon]